YLVSPSGSSRAIPTFLSNSASVWRSDVAERRSRTYTVHASSMSMVGRARGSTFAFCRPRKSPSACRRSRTWPSTGNPGASSMSATLKSRRRFCRGGRSFSAQPAASMSSGPAMTPSARARSSALRASGPTTSMSTGACCHGSAWPVRGTMPHVGLWPYTPQKWAGLRMDEPMSLPASSAVSPAASAAAEPPEDPPGQRAIGRARPRARPFEVADHDGVQRVVVLLDAREIEVEQLETADLLPTDVRGELSGGAERDVEHRRLLGLHVATRG